MNVNTLSVQEVVFGIDDAPGLLRMVQQADRDGLDIFSLSCWPGR